MIYRILHGLVSFLLIFEHFLGFLLDVRKRPSVGETDFHYFCKDSEESAQNVHYFCKDSEESVQNELRVIDK